jgi:hypothetical protein
LDGIDIVIRKTKCFDIDDLCNELTNDFKIQLLPEHIQSLFDSIIEFEQEIQTEHYVIPIRHNGLEYGCKFEIIYTDGKGEISFVDRSNSEFVSSWGAFAIALAAKRYLKGSAKVRFWHNDDYIEPLGVNRLKSRLMDAMDQAGLVDLTKVVSVEDVEVSYKKMTPEKYTFLSSNLFRPKNRGTLNALDPIATLKKYRQHGKLDFYLRDLQFEILKFRQLHISMMSLADLFEMYAESPYFVDEWFKWSLEKDGPSGLKYLEDLVAHPKNLFSDENVLKWLVNAPASTRHKGTNTYYGGTSFVNIVEWRACNVFRGPESLKPPTKKLREVSWEEFSSYCLNSFVKPKAKFDHQALLVQNLEDLNSITQGRVHGSSEKPMLLASAIAFRTAEIITKLDSNWKIAISDDSEGEVFMKNDEICWAFFPISQAYNDMFFSRNSRSLIDVATMVRSKSFRELSTISAIAYS